MSHWLAPVLTCFVVYLHIAYIAVPKEWTFLDALSIDKWIHALMFFFLTFSWRIHNSWCKQLVVLWFIELLLFGVGMEAMQALMTTYRTREWADVIADSIGVIVAFWFFKTKLFAGLRLPHYDGKKDISSKDQ